MPNMKFNITGQVSGFKVHSNCFKSHTRP